MSAVDEIDMRLLLLKQAARNADEGTNPSRLLGAVAHESLSERRRSKLFGAYCASRTALISGNAEDEAPEISAAEAVCRLLFGDAAYVAAQSHLARDTRTLATIGPRFISPDNVPLAGDAA